MKGFQKVYILNDINKLIVHFIYLMTKIKNKKLNCKMGFVILMRFVKLHNWMYIPAYIVFNLFDWGISLQLLRRFKVYNKKGTQTDSQAG